MLETVWLIGPYNLVSGDDLDVRVSGSAQWYLQKAKFLPRERTALDDMIDQMGSWPKI